MSYLKKLQNIVKLAEKSEASIAAREFYNHISKLIGSTDNKEVSAVIAAGKESFSSNDVDNLIWFDEELLNKIRNYSWAEYTTDTFNPKFSLNKDERAMIAISDIMYEFSSLIKDYIRSGELKKDILSTAFPNKDWLNIDFYSNVKQYLNKQQEEWHRKSAEKQNKQKDSEFKELQFVADVGKFKLYYVPGIEDGQFRWNNKQDRSHDRTLLGNKLGLCLGAQMGYYQDNNSGMIYGLLEGDKVKYCIRVSERGLHEMRGMQNSAVKLEDYDILDDLNNILKFKFSFNELNSIRETGIESVFGLAQHFSEFREVLKTKSDLKSKLLLNPQEINNLNLTSGVANDILKYYPELYAYCNKQTEQLSIHLITSVNVAILKYARQTSELCLAAVNKYGSALRYVKPEMQTEAMCMAAVKQNGLALRYVKPEMQTEAVCMAAVNNYGDALAYVKPEMQTEEICLAAVNQNFGALAYVKPEMQTEAMCMAAVKQNGNALRYVKPEMRTEEICLAAVNDYGYALAYVKPEMQTEAICMAAVNKDGFSLRHVKLEMRTEAICMAAVMKDGNALEHVKPEMQTEAICLAAVEQDDYALRVIKDPIMRERVRNKLNILNDDDDDDDDDDMLSVESTLLSKIIKLANKFDEQELYKEADELDHIIGLYK